MPLQRVLIRGLMFVRGRRDRPDRPVDPDWGIDEGDLGGGDLEGGQLPIFPGRPGHGLPPSFPGFPERPGHGLPWPGRPVDPDYGIDENLPGIGGGPIIPERPVLPARPGHPLPRPEIPVVQALPIEEGMEVPTGAPHQPGCLVVVYASKSAPKAIGWLQGAGDLPETKVPAPPGSPPGHWIPVEIDPRHAVCRDSDPEAVGWCFVFEIGADFGKLKPTPKR